MARTTATNFSGGLQFPYATAATDLFKKEDVQTLALAVDGHDHSAGKGLALPSGLITSAMIADGTIVAGDIANSTITGAKIANETITTTNILDGTIASGDLAANAVSQIVFAQGSTNNPTTTSASFADMPQMACTLTTIAGSTLVCWIVSNVNHSAAGGVVNLALALDAAAEVALIGNNAATAGGAFTVSTMWIFTGMTAGSHTVKGRWSTNAATLSAGGVQRSLLVIELRR